MARSIIEDNPNSFTVTDPVIRERLIKLIKSGEIYINPNKIKQDNTPIPDQPLIVIKQT